MVWLCGELPFGRVSEVLERLAGIRVAASSAWRLVQEWGERLGAVLEAERCWGGAAPEEGAKRMGVAMDGGMVHIRGEGWKEVKVGCVFAVGQRVEFDPLLEEPVELGCAQRPSYVAHLGGPEEFGRKLWEEAQRRGWERAWETEALGDGAPWIWNLVQEHFYDSQQVVDWFHAVEHLGAAMRCLFGEGSEEGRDWYQRARRLLYQGHARRVAKELEVESAKRPQWAEDLRREAHYFWHNHRRMQYMAMREEGWCIGSGVVESGVKQYKERFARAGMRWTRRGAERMILIRSAVLSDRFTEMWRKARTLPSN